MLRVIWTEIVNVCENVAILGKSQQEDKQSGLLSFVMRSGQKGQLTFGAQSNKGNMKGTQEKCPKQFQRCTKTVVGKQN